MQGKKIATTVSIIGLLLLSGCGGVYDSHQDGYAVITAIDHVKFEIPEKFLTEATAITNISEEVDYGTDTYLYKDGSKNYMLFNMGSVVVVVTNTTDYDLVNEKDVSSAIMGKAVDGIWMNPSSGKKIKTNSKKTKTDYKVIGDVTGDVSITTEQYGKFEGKFSYVQTNNFECSMFVGVNKDVYGTLSGNQKKIIDHIAKSLEVAEDQEVVYNTETQMGTGNGENSKKEPNTEEDKLLKIGDTGKIRIVDDTGKKTLEENVKFVHLYTADDAVKIIKDYCGSQDSLYDYKDAPDGYTWHVAEYTLGEKPEKAYVDIKLCGLDGNLQYNGVKISSRTYDIFERMEKDGDGYSQLYCYYAVPNGCKEYVLEFGTVINEETKSVKYLVNNY